MKRQPDIKNYTANKPYKAHDYIALQKKNGVAFGLCEIEGIRYDEQEDALVFSTQAVAAWPQLSDEVIKQALQQTFAQLQEQFGQIDYLGTTCCSVAAWLDIETKKMTLWTANLGDSTGFVVIVDQNKKVRTALCLHPLHDPAAPEEFQRLTQIKIQTTEGEIAAAQTVLYAKEVLGVARLGGVRLSRGFGDTHIEQYGFIHEPDIFKNEILLQTGDQAFIIVACDGLTEGGIVTAEKAGEIIASAPLASEEQLAQALVAAAYNAGNGSTDNISVGVFRITKTPASLTVFDGHGGHYRGDKLMHRGMSAARLVERISAHFYATLNEKLRL